MFDRIIFGPVSSRRLGQSLGINLLPADQKICNFDCIYCECGLTDGTQAKMPRRGEIKEKLKTTLQEFRSANKPIDAITFAGNGEPTIHKDFIGIIDDTYLLRNEYFPKAKIALLTNSTTIASPRIRETFKKIDQPILKLDSVKPETVELLNCPLGKFNLEKTIGILKSMDKPIIQTMFLKGTYKGLPLDNTTNNEIIPWLETLNEIQPSLVMMYTIARDTPFETLKKISMDQLEAIASRVEGLGFETQISG